jgi:hypothetical protein
VVIYGASVGLRNVSTIVEEPLAIRVLVWWISVLVFLLHVAALLLALDLVISLFTGSATFSGQLGRHVWKSAVERLLPFVESRTNGTKSFIEQAAPLRPALIGTLCLLVMMFGIRWQALTFLGDTVTRQQRMKWALIVVGSCVTGATTWGIFGLIDAKSNITPLDAAGYVLGVAIVGVAFLMKTWMGPILLTATLSWSVYMLLVYGEWSLIPVFNIIVETFLSFAPAYADQFYTAFTLLFSMLGSMFSVANLRQIHFGS